FADILEAPWKMHAAIAIGLVGALLNRNGVTIRHGAARYPLDLWIALLSGSGFGRSTMLNMAEPLFDRAKLDGLGRNSEWGSPQGFKQELSQNPCGLFMWGELGEKLEQLNNNSFTSLKEWITDRYDNLRTPATLTYRQSGRGSDTPPIVFTSAPRLN